MVINLMLVYYKFCIFLALRLGFFLSIVALINRAILFLAVSYIFLIFVNKSLKSLYFLILQLR